jgi:hypothetical protein
MRVFENGKDPNAQGLTHRFLGALFNRRKVNHLSGSFFPERHFTGPGAIDTVYIRNDMFDKEWVIKLGRDRETQNQIMEEHGLHRSRETQIFPFLLRCLLLDDVLFRRKPIDPTGAWYPTFMSGVEQACTTYFVEIGGENYSLYSLLNQNPRVVVDTLIHYANQMLIKAALQNNAATGIRRPDFQSTGRRRLAQPRSRFSATTR